MLMAMIGTSGPWIRTIYILNKYLRLTYLYNAILVEHISRVARDDMEVCRRLLKSILKSKHRWIRSEVVPRLLSCFKYEQSG